MMILQCVLETDDRESSFFNQLGEKKMKITHLYFLLPSSRGRRASKK